MAATGPVHHVSAGDDRAQGKAVGDPFGEANDVPGHPPVLRGEHPARSSDAGLNFIEHEQDTVFITELTEPGQEFGRRDNVTALPLNWLHKDRRQLIWWTGRAEERVHAFEIAIPRV